MSFDKVRIAGLVISILVIILVAMVIFENPFPAFAYADSPTHLIPVTDDVGLISSDFMWERRSIDLIAQAMVLFSTATGCLALLRAIGTKMEVDSE